MAIANIKVTLVCPIEKVWNKVTALHNFLGGTFCLCRGKRCGLGVYPRIKKRDGACLRANAESL